MLPAPEAYMLEGGPFLGTLAHFRVILGRQMADEVSIASVARSPFTPSFPRGKHIHPFNLKLCF